jgi:hypothetical protein
MSRSRISGVIPNPPTSPSRHDVVLCAYFGMFVTFEFVAHTSGMIPHKYRVSSSRGGRPEVYAADNLRRSDGISGMRTSAHRNVLRVRETWGSTPPPETGYSDDRHKP